MTTFHEAIRPAVGKASGGTSCAVAAVDLEAGQREALLTETAQAALRPWSEALNARPISARAAPVAAHQVSVLLITFLDGMQVLCRAVGDLTAFHDARAAVAALITTSLDPTVHPPLDPPRQ